MSKKEALIYDLYRLMRQTTFYSVDNDWFFLSNMGIAFLTMHGMRLRGISVHEFFYNVMTDVRSENDCTLACERYFDFETWETHHKLAPAA